MSGIQCNKCGSTNIDTDSPCGGVVCIACGNVLEDSGIVSEVQYVQDSRGANRAVGQLVSFEDGMSYGLGARYGFGRESRAITLQNARQNIQALASQLQLRPHAVDTALNYYKLALTKGLTKGRKSTHVVAACVYMVCRKDGTSHMLLDLSDVLKINVYDLGKTFLKLSTELKINTPAIDPILYVARFARQLQFDDKENEVIMTATKLIQRMKSDWIHFGRRPSGLCGAALLVAARIHNFNRTVEDVIKVVKVCQATVRKRLNEFGDTPSGKLSIEDFMTINLSEEQDPPSFKRARKKLRELEDDGKIKDLEDQMMEIRKQIEYALETTRKKTMYSKYAEAEDEGESQDSGLPSNSPSSSVDRIIAENTLDSLKDIICCDVDDNDVDDDNSPDSVMSHLIPLLSEESESISVEDNDSAPLSSDAPSKGLEPDLEIVMGLKTRVNETAQAQDDIVEDPEGKLDLTDIDDADLEKYFMQPFETQKKDEFWHKYNADYLEEMREREERRALEEEENAKKPSKKKRTNRKRGPIHANSPGEAMSKVFHQKKISNKLNYDILKSLNPECPMTDLVMISEKEPQPESNSPSVKSVRVRPPKPKPVLTVPFDIKKGMSEIIGSNRRKVLAALAEEQNSSQEPEPKKLKIMEPELVTVEPDVIAGTLGIEDGHIKELDIEEEDEDEEEIVDSEEEYGFPKNDRPPDFDEYDDYIEPYDD